MTNSLVLVLQFANPAARTMAGFTIIGTTTSFVFISSNSVPLLPYRTRLDNYFIFQVAAPPPGLSLTAPFT